METQEIKQTLHESLKIGAEIASTEPNKPWQYFFNEWQGTYGVNLAEIILRGYPIRIKPLELLTPGDGRELHNPDKLTTEEVGEQKRLWLREELDGRHSEGKNGAEVWNASGKGWWPAVYGMILGCTYRVPASVPWPPHKWAKEMEAHKAWKQVQFRRRREGPWLDLIQSPNVNWNLESREFRIAPSQIPFDKDNIVPTMVFTSDKGATWANVGYVKEDGVFLVAWGRYTYKDLQTNWLYSLPWPQGGKPDWKPCSKQS